MVIRKIADSPSPTPPTETPGHEPPQVQSTQRAGLPSDNPTASYWLRDPSPVLLGHRSTPELPAAADVVIVGSGITGAFAARYLKEYHGRAKHDSSVVMLEAREACSGATGRNGGHCQPLVYGSAPAVAAFELEVFNFLERLVREEGVECDWVSLTGVHAFLSEDMFELAAAAAEQLKRSHPELGAQLEVVRSSDDDTSSSSKLASLRVPSACGAIIQKKAASLWPYKLVASVLESLLARFPAPSFNLQTNTPATSLSRSETGSGWVVATPRGSITARQVLLATNGYTSHLLPAFAGLIVPVRGQIGALIPPTSSSGTPPVKLTHSYVFAAEPDPNPNPGHGAQHSLTAAATSAAAVAPRDDYLVQRPLLPSGGGEFIYGGGRRFARNLGVGQWRDDEIEEDVARYLRANLAPPLDLASSSSPSLVGGTKEEEEGVEGKHELKASFQWTGVMGYSRDAHAWVGPVPESLGGGGPRGGLYVCAGYTGHGMPAAALSAREVARLMVESATMAEGCGVDEEEEEEEGKKGGVRLPEEFKLTEQRVARAKALPELTQGWEATNFAALISGVVP